MRWGAYGQVKRMVTIQYWTGYRADVPADLADGLIQSGHAMLVGEVPETAAVEAAERAVMKRPRKRIQESERG